MKAYAITLTGTQPLIMHHDNIEWADRMDAWRLVPQNKAVSKAGDDRTPPYRWLGCLYHNGEVVGIPHENIMRSVMDGGTRVLVPGGRGGKTFKAQTQSGIIPRDMFWLLLVKGQPVPVAPLFENMEKRTWEEHNTVVVDHGFMLYLKRARVGNAKHIRVRPRFDIWSASGTLLVRDEKITRDVLTQILALAGEYSGLCDWRCSSPQRPGPFGTFTATVDPA